VPNVRKILVAAFLFILGYVMMQATRCDSAAGSARLERTR
jgi:hypothetical protein